MTSKLARLYRSITPLNEVQLNQLPQDVDNDAKPVRFLADGQCVNFATGYGVSRGSNIIDHYVYWDRPKAYIDMVLKFLRENNPKVKFRITYH